MYKGWKRAILESPYAGEVEKNKLYAIACGKDMMSRKEAVFASHLIYPLFIQKYNEEERNNGIDAGQTWYGMAEICCVYLDLGMTPGMIQGVARAESFKIPVERRLLPAWI